MLRNCMRFSASSLTNFYFLTSQSTTRILSPKLLSFSNISLLNNKLTETREGEPCSAEENVNCDKKKLYINGKNFTMINDIDIKASHDDEKEDYESKVESSGRKDNVKCSVSQSEHQKELANELYEMEEKNVKVEEKEKQFAKTYYSSDSHASDDEYEEKYSSDDDEYESDEEEQEKFDKHVHFLKLPRRSHVFSNVISAAKSQKHAKVSGTAMIEGKRMLYDIMSRGIKPTMLFFSRLSDVLMLDVPESVKLYKVPYSDIKFWTDVKTNQGVIGIFKVDDIRKKQPNHDAIPLTVICDRVRNPLNVGSIMRTAAAVGCRRIILTKECASIWNPKALRAGAGAHLCVPVMNFMSWEEIKENLGYELNVLLAEEVSNEFEIMSEKKPMKSPWRRTKTMYANNLPLVSCHSVNYWEGRDIVLVIGGEVTGISDGGYEMCFAYKGKRIYIPMCNNINSLNSGSAFSVIAYELRRQWDAKHGIEKEQIKVNAENKEPFQGIGIYNE